MEKLKSAILKSIVFVLIATIMIGGYNLFYTRNASAATPSLSAPLFTGKVVKTVDIGDDIVINTVGANVTVSIEAPDGSVTDNVNNTDNKVKATLIGNYIVTYKGLNNKSYSYNVLCKEDREYFINVFETKDDFIPSYREEGGSIRLPKAQLVYTNSKGELVEYKDKSGNPIPVTVSKIGGADETTEEVTLPDGTKENRKKYTNLDGGVFTIVYSASLSDKKIYRKEYNINVQSENVYKNAPTISITSFTTTSNTNTLFTLPKAEAKDDYDQNPFVEIKVIGPDNKPVRVYETDENGYAIIPTDGDGNEILTGRKDVEFNNETQRSFFTALEGKYRVSYVAYNGGGLPSTDHTYTIESRDKLAPVITELDENRLPYKWGKDVKMGNGIEPPTANARPEGTKFDFPFPNVADNTTDRDDLKVTITMVNPNNRTVAKWEGSVEDFESTNGVELTSAYSSFFKSASDAGVTNFNFKADNMKFSFDYFDFTGNTYFKSKSNEKFGDWTINYTVRDDALNGATGTAKKVVNINLSEELIDLEKPVIIESEFDLPKYVLVNGDNDSFYVPTVGVSDNIVPLNKLVINYTMTSNIDVANFAGTSVEVDGETYKLVDIDGVDYKVIREYDVKGGETFAIEKEGANHFILIKEDNRNYAMQLKSGTDAQIQLAYNVSDNVGNSAQLSPIAPIDIIYPETIVQDLSVSDSIDLNGVNGEKVEKGKSFNLGSFEVSGIKYRDYTGFELSITADDGEKTESISTTAWTYFVEDAANTHKLFVRDITFTPAYGATYRLNARFYDLSGNSKVISYAFTMQDADKDVGTVTSSAVLGTSGNINTPYALTDSYTVSPKNDNAIIVRKITARSFALVGNNFIGLTSSSYTIFDYIYDSTATGFSNKDFFKTEEDANRAVVYGTYAGFMSEAEVPVIEIQGTMPLYIADVKTQGNFLSYGIGGDDDGNDQYLVLPIITAYTVNENAEVTISVELTNADNRSPKKIESRLVYLDNAGNRTFEEKTGGNSNKSTGRYAFSPSEDGFYKVTVEAITSSGKKSTTTHTIQVGKRTLPKFRVLDQITTATEGDIFFAGKVDFLSDEAPEDLTVTITLNDPNSSNVYTRTYKGNEIKNSDWFNDYSETDVVFNSGTYKLVITVEDKAGNVSTERIDIVVSSKGKGSNANMTALTTVLIIIGILLIIGAVIYVVRFKAVKK